MKKLSIIIISILLLAGCSKKEVSNTENSYNSHATRTSINNSTTNNNSNNINNTEVINITLAPHDGTYVEETELSSFTTKLLTDDANRENNIDITCSKINNFIVKPGETFSFTNTVGKSTEQKGYEKANIFDAEGNTIKGLGGGNCQVSSTLYNAVLQANLEVIERHDHSNEVYYVEKGKDAAVAYGSLDFKFKNNTSNNIKIYASSTEEDVTVKLIKMI